MSGLSLLVLVLGCLGCQTFTLSEEDYLRQQRGEVVDPETGAIVGGVGSAAYLGATIGYGIAAALGK